MIKINNHLISRWALFTIMVLLLVIQDTSAKTKNGKMQISRLTGDFYIYTTYGSYKGNAVPANGMYLVTDSGVVLFDTPWDTTQMKPLLTHIKQKHKKEVVLCLSTHAHDDRTAGLNYLNKLDIPTYTTVLTDSICLAKNENRASHLLQKDTVFTIGNHSFQTFYPGAGHTIDNIVVWFENEKILYGGCFIKSIDATDLGNVSEAKVEDWASSIQAVQHKFPQPRFIIPGHDNWHSPNALTHTLELVTASQHK